MNALLVTASSSIHIPSTDPDHLPFFNKDNNKPRSIPTAHLHQAQQTPSTMKTSTYFALTTLITLGATQSVVEVSNGVTTTLTGAAASSWQSSFSSDLSSNLASVTSSCFPFCNSTNSNGASATNIPNGSSLASSIRSEVSSAVGTASSRSGVPNASSLASSISSQVASAVGSASSAASTSSTSSASGNVAASFGGFDSAHSGWFKIMSLGAGVIGVAAVVL